MKLAIVIPAHNEEDNIKDIIKKVEETVDIPFELVVIDDHSQDNTNRIVRDLSKEYKNLYLVENKHKKGFANALKTGFSNVTADIVIPIMADSCDDLSTIRKMWDKINLGYDVVCGSRYIKGGRRIGGSKIKGFFSWFGGWSLHFLLGIPTHDIANAFKMYRKRVIESIDIRACGFEISMEIPLKAYYLGFKITEVPTVWMERKKGKSSFRIFRLLPNYIKLYMWAFFRKLTRKMPL
ncbi:MAG: glycosyltransferase [Candidatus Omnitrophica bacterium]|nr:glycosyltransferase [Candidatus Omnitrophota bacterium]